MTRVVLQVPLDRDVRIRATAMAKEYGFSSLQEFFRVFLVALIKGNVDLSILHDDRKLVKKPSK